MVTVVHVVFVDLHSRVSFLENSAPATEREVRSLADDFGETFGDTLRTRCDAEEARSTVISAEIGSAITDHRFELLYNFPEEAARWRKFFSECDDIATAWAVEDWQRCNPDITNADVSISHDDWSEDSFIDPQPKKSSTDSALNRAPEHNHVRPQSSSKTNVPDYRYRLWALLGGVALVAGGFGAAVGVLLYRIADVSKRMERLEVDAMKGAPVERAPPQQVQSVECPPARIYVRPK